MTTARIQGLTTPEETAAAARSALYARLAQALAFPSPELAQAAARGELLAGLGDELAALPFPLHLPPQDRAALADPALDYPGLEEEYIRLFEVGPGRPPCPLYEGAHRGGRMKLMEELVRFYHHFGLRSLPGDLPDHLCAELEFMHYLSFKEAAARRAGQPPDPYRRAQRDFLERHLCRWLPRLRARLESCGPPPFYRALLRLAEELCRLDLANLKGGGAKPDS